ncbi:MAG: universal stress protein [Gammaproteobacteria bacterium]|jgi:nucleotide-binding universal stress UspA family protein|nr:universal stress protein [Gammaproteobacteria bacterium]
MASEDRLPQVGFSKILYVTDLSRSGRKAFPYAASIARRYDAEVTVFHVIEAHSFEKYPIGYISELPPRNVPLEPDAARREATS